MLVDMAGSENIEQAGQVGFEAKMQVKIVSRTVHPPLPLCSLRTKYFLSITDSKD